MGTTPSPAAPWPRALPDHLADRFGRRQQEHRSAGYWRDESVSIAFAAAVATQPDQAWTFYGGARDRSVTLAELGALAAGRAQQLQRLGAESGDVLVMRLPNSLEAAITYFGAALAGLVVFPVGVRDRLATLAPLIESAAARWIVVEHAAAAEDAVPVLGSTVEAVVVSGRGAVPAGTRALEVVPAELAPAVRDRTDGLHALSYTSGSTSTPKIVVYTDAQLLFETRTLRAALSTRGALLVPSPVGHVTGLLNLLLLPLTRSDPVVAMEQWDAALAVEFARRHRCTELRGTTVYVQEMSTVAPDLGGIRTGMVGGGPVAPDLVRSMDERGVRLVRAYGSTEHPTVSSSTETDPLAVRSETDGAVLDGAEVRVVTEDGGDVQPGETGEILSRGADAAAGYLDPILDAEGFDGDGWFRTGDLGVLDRDHRLTIRDRVKDIIIRGGENISAKEVEDVLHEMPGIHEVSLVGVPDDRLGERACLFARAGTAVTLDHVRAFLAARGVEKYKWPEHVELVDTFPRTASGKVRKQELRERWTRRG